MASEVTIKSDTEIVESYCEGLAIELKASLLEPVSEDTTPVAASCYPTHKASKTTCNDLRDCLLQDISNIRSIAGAFQETDEATAHTFQSME